MPSLCTKRTLATQVASPAMPCVTSARTIWGWDNFGGKASPVSGGFAPSRPRLVHQMSAVQVVIDLMEVALHAEGVGFREVHRDGRASSHG
jgi:hypothetical protein